MAGRLQQKAEKVTQLEAEALSVEIGMFTEIPTQYRERSDNSPLCMAWLDAMDAVTLAHLAMQRLGDSLRKGAMITRAGPYEELIVAKGGVYEPVPEHWSLASACVEIVRRRAQVDCDPDNRTRAAAETQGME